MLLIPCFNCGCHLKSSETDCPHCGARARRSDGSVQRTAAAVALGLTAAITSCELTATAVYGVSCSSDCGPYTTSSAASSTGGGAMSTSSGHGGSPSTSTGMGGMGGEGGHGAGGSGGSGAGGGGDIDGGTEAGDGG